MGKGKDQIEAIASESHQALHNHGVIKLGKGSDKLNVLAGGLDGTGKIKLGNGKDVFLGFGIKPLSTGARDQTS